MALIDQGWQDRGMDSPYINAFAVTPSDANDLDVSSGVLRLPRALWVGGAGAISLITSGGQTVLVSGIPAGTLLKIRATRVRATGTTATLILALY